jgi:AcrR family transcriptional regulator
LTRDISRANLQTDWSFLKIEIINSQARMSKGDITRENIISQAAALFNSRGFAGASMSELMQVTGLKKGGIYNHFQSKEEILVEAFQYSVKVVQQKITEAIRNETTAKGRLKGIIEFYRDYPMNPVIKGGCPILNSIVDSDNTNSVLRDQVKEAVNELIRVLAAIIASGIRKGEFKADVDPEKAAVLIFTTIEGAVAVSRNYEDNRYMEIISDQLIKYVDNELGSIKK